MINDKVAGLLTLVFYTLLISCGGKHTLERHADVVVEGEPTGRWNDGLERYQESWPSDFDIGQEASKAFIDKWDIDVRPDGKGLPKKGAGLARAGAVLYASKCASCHGQKGYEGPYDKLVTDSTGRNTIGNYWPYATTIFDYVRRAMPFDAPGSLSDQQVYDITAYLLYLNNIIKEDYVVDYKSLPAIDMPAKDRFVIDDRTGGKEIR